MEGNFANVTARNGAATQTPVTGAYEVTISHAGPHKKEDGTTASILFDGTIVGGDYAGSVIKVWVGTDLSKAGNNRSWKTALLSIGTPSSQVDGPLRYGEATFKGKKAFMYFKAKEEGVENSQRESYFITPDAFASLKGNASQVASGSVPQVSVQKPNGGSVRSLLG
jgi:hypothetical protein